MEASATVAGTLSAAAGMLLAGRRLTGAIPEYPGLTAVLGVGAVGVALLAITVVAEWRGCPPLPAWLARLGLLLGVAAVTLPPRFSSPGAVVAAVAALGLAIAATLATSSRSIAVARRSPAAGPPPQHAPTGSIPEGLANAAVAPPAGDDVVQRFERRTLADGRERVDGMIRVAVPRGSRLGWGHVGFCPPFTASPTVEVATGYDAVEATVTAAEVLPWGVRIEVRLDDPAEETLDIPVDVAARAAA